MRMLSAIPLLVMLAAPAQAQRWTPDAGTRPYHLEITEHIPGRPDHGYRMDYDLVSDRKGVVAIVRSAEKLDGPAVTPIALADDCRAALHAGPGELARVTFAPISPEAASTLGPDFLAACAPPDLFDSVSEAFRVTMLQLAPQFGLARLAAPGDSRRVAAFGTHVDRPDITLDLDAPGGTMAFVSAQGSKATIDWTPDRMTVKLVNRVAIPGAEVRADGTAHFAMRLEIDRATGALTAATATDNGADLILDIKDAPPIPFSITRDITIRPRG